MSDIKSYAVGNGDMFCIHHNSDNFTIIDCSLDEDRGPEILSEVARLSNTKGVTRFISTHPDEDHIRGLDLLDDRIHILNFYCVENTATKDDETDSFIRYRELRDSTKAFYISKGCSRRWMNLEGNGRGSSGIDVLWPDLDSQDFKNALQAAADGESPNNISPIVKYSVREGATALWMGDLETNFFEAIEDDLDLPAVDILFAPHHGRDSGRIPETMLVKMAPKIIVVGEAPSEHLNYYAEYNTVTQNSAGDIIFECGSGTVHVFTSQEYEAAFLDDEACRRPGYYYVGTLNL